MGCGSISKEESIRREGLFNQGIKVCSHCKRELPTNMFYRDSSTKDGFASFCKDCKREQEVNRKGKRQKWIEENREKIRTRDRLPENKAKRKQYRESHREQERARRKHYDTTAKGRYSIYKQNAKQRNIEFDLTFEDFDNITKQPCFYCGGFNGKCDDISYGGLDRIDSNNGYILDNVVPCCEICNKMKLDHDLHDFLEHIKKIINYTFGTED